MSKQLAAIQKSLKAPKGQYNSFGKYKYRSCEDILEAVKPILAITGTSLTLSDTLEYIGDRYYIKATATLVDNETMAVIGQTTAYAREEEVKKGMDGSQITGTASSYARKYALNGLFLIDDTKDADTDEFKNENDRKKENAVAEQIVEEDLDKKITDKDAKVLEGMLKPNQIEWVKDHFGIKELTDMTGRQKADLMASLKAQKEKKDGKQSKTA